ncbi:molecular chaperone, partial [Aureobasidium melanogenum]
MSTEYNYDEQGQFFPFFFVTVAGLVTLPVTYSLLKPSKDLENTATRIESSYTPEHADLIDGHRRRQKRRERKIKRMIVAGLGWTTIALMVYLMAVTQRSAPKIWDPYEILGIPMSSTEKQIQSRYRRLSVTMHPDKAVPDPAKNETVETVNERWVEVIKAYKALTDEDVRRNFIEYGNPDGKQSTSFGIALPQFLITEGNGKYILLVYGALLGILLPY